MFYEESVVVDLQKVVEISKIQQNTNSWKAERKFRITASQCYKLYTYAKNKKPDWGQKLCKYFKEPFLGNFATNYGLEQEIEAKNVLGTKYSILSTGLIIHPDEPWIRYSPDGY